MKYSVVFFILAFHVIFILTVLTSTENNVQEVNPKREQCRLVIVINTTENYTRNRMSWQ